MVQDRDSVTGKYLTNIYLTYNSTFTAVNEVPSLQDDYLGYQFFLYEKAH